jgi:hypothetical protein
MSWREDPERPVQGIRALVRVLLDVAAAAVPTAWLLPWLAAAGLALAWGLGAELPAVPGMPVLAGPAAALVAWLLVVVAYIPMTDVERAQPASYAALRNLQRGLEARVDRIERRCGGREPEAAACAEARKHLDWVHEHLGPGRGLQWVLGHGYLAAWARIHRAEEALIGAYDRPELAMQADHDDLRLRGAELPQRKRLRKMLRDAHLRLDWGCWPRAGGEECLADVRETLREVRYAINDVRDASRYGLLRLRNQTLAVLFLAEAASFSLLATAVLAGATRRTIVAGMTYFLVGVTVGLFSRLHRQSQSDSAVDDYGLTLARTCTLPVYAGLAAVGGVVVQGLTRTSAEQLGQVFSLTHNPGGVVVGAVFAVAPALLFKALGEQSQKYRENIRSTEAIASS